MEIASVSNRMITQRINAMLGRNYGEAYMSQVRQGKEGSAALRKIVRDETATMLMQAAEAARDAANG